MRLSRHFTSMRFPCMSIYALTLAWEQSRWLDRSKTSVLSGKRRTKLPSNSFVSRSLNSIEVQNGTSIELDTKSVKGCRTQFQKQWIPNSTIQSQKDKFFMWNLPSIFQDPRSQIQSTPSHSNYDEPVYQRCILRSLVEHLTKISVTGQIFNCFVVSKSEMTMGSLMALL